MFQHFHVRSPLRLSKKAAVISFLSSIVWRCLVVLLLALPVTLFNQRTALAADEPTLTIANTTVELMNGNTFSVPVTFDNGVHNISAMNFSLNYDETCLTFDGVTDAAPNDSIPDAITGLPTVADGYVSTVSYDEDDTGGEIDISISDQTNPQNALADDTFTFQFGVQASCRTTNGTTRAVAFAYDTDPSPTFGNTAGAAVTGVTTGGTYTLRFNAYPTDIALTATSVNENASSGTAVGTLSSTDPDADLNDTHTYSLVSGTGDTDNSLFAIDGSSLETNAVFNFEADSSYAIRLRTTDSYGGTFEEQFTITIVDVNEAPTSLSINDSDVNENAASNTAVGTLSSVDPDAGASASFSLVTGTGSTDNTSFNISGTQLRTSASFNYESKNTYSIRVRVTDNGSLMLDTIFVIRVNDVNDAPVANDDTFDGAEQVVSGVVDLTILTNDTDEDRDDRLSISAMSTPNSGSVITATSTSLRYTPGDFNGVVNFNYTARDNHSGTLTDTATVSFTVVTADARGDCNSDGAVNAGDFSAIALEFFDTDVNSNWYQTYASGFAGSPRGCDANASKSVAISDLTCTILVFFGNSACTTSGLLAAEVASEANLAVAPDLTGVPNSTVEVPILLQTNGNRVAAASFALSFDENQLGFDATDADGNGVPDAVTFETPSGMVPMVSYNEDAGRLEITVYSVMMPMPTLTDGPVANVTFHVNDVPSVAETSVDLVLGSLGSDQGQAVPVQMSGGSVQIVQQNRTFYLPLVNR